MKKTNSKPIGKKQISEPVRQPPRLPIDPFETDEDMEEFKSILADKMKKLGKKAMDGLKMILFLLFFVFAGKGRT